MLCSECGKRPATLHYTKIINGNKTESHLCEVCAQEKGEYMSHMESGISFHQLLSGFLNFEPSLSSLKQPANESEALRCSSCGLTYNQFSKIGRFGCADCYQSFDERLGPVLRRVHGHSAHRGKIPERSKGELKIRREVDQLKEKLAEKVHAEEFEEAARLRDEIRSLTERLDK